MPIRMYDFFTTEEKRKKCDSCKLKIEPPGEFFAYGKQTVSYDIVARRICMNCFRRLSVEGIMKALRVSLVDSMEVAQSISDLKKPKEKKEDR